MTQYFKSVYFNDHPAQKAKNKSITIAFNNSENYLYNFIKNLSNEEIRERIGIYSYKQLELFASKEDRKINQLIKILLKRNSQDNININPKDVTFANSKSLPFSRWYTYIEGYSPEFVSNLIQQYCPKAQRIYDPFVGTGTTIFAADKFNIKTLFSEVNPLLQYLIQVKMSILNLDYKKRSAIANKLNMLASNIIAKVSEYPEDGDLRNNYYLVFKKSRYFNNSTFNTLLKLSSYIADLKNTDPFLANSITIATLASLVPISYLVKAGDLRFKNESELLKKQITIDEYLPNKIKEIANDVKNQEFILQKDHEFITSDANNIDLIDCDKIDAIITSPPYLNGTNYFRNTKLELWFLKYILNENDLRIFRNQSLTSGINDVKSENMYCHNIDSFKITPILSDTLKQLKIKSYDNRIPIMVKDYFKEMRSIFEKLKVHLKRDATLLIDIGDSIFAGVHVRTDDILAEIVSSLGYKMVEKKLLRKRRSRNRSILSQVLLVFKFNEIKSISHNKHTANNSHWMNNWKHFKNTLPHREPPYNKRNWGHPIHSLCSYQGKLKVSIANNLIKTFVPDNGIMLDPFSGVGTIPFESALNGRKSYGIDISLPAYYISYAKVSHLSQRECDDCVQQLSEFISVNKCSGEDIRKVKEFGFNKTIADYYEQNTLKEIILARKYFSLHKPKTPNEMLVISCLLHILHGNRPYALSRQSHPIVPYAPTGKYIYKDLIRNLQDKIGRTFTEPLPTRFVPGKIFNKDVTSIWPQEISNIDAIITSPPFYDSTRFYLANWIRIWFAGWNEDDFRNKINSFIEVKQKYSFEIYQSIFRQGRERMKRDGVFVLHLGQSAKCDMAAELIKVSKRWFRKADLFYENVEHCESHGIRDKGTVTTHQYLVLE